MATALTEVTRYVKSHDFKRAILMTAVMVASGVCFYLLGWQGAIIGVCIGVLLTSFCDVQGSFRHRTWAMLLSIALNVFTVLLVNVLYPSLWLLLLYFTIAVFIISILAVYGTRASLFAFSGLLGIVLSLVRIHEGWAILEHAMTIAIGGLFYVIATSIYHCMTRKSQINQQLGELALLTADFLTTRLHHVKADDKKVNQQELLDLQVQITEKQETLRELILSDQVSGGQSNTRNRQMLILVELIDVMELAVANPSHFQQIINHLEESQTHRLDCFLDISEYLAYQLHCLAKVLLDNGSTKDFSKIDQLLNKAQHEIDDYIEEIGLPKARPAALAMFNFHDYLEKQTANIHSIDRLLNNVARQRTISLGQKGYGKFLSKEDYSPEILLENLSIQSPIFRHALRATVAMVAGYLIGHIFDISNAYWILLTIVVILRPSYGLTKERSQKRVLGTIIGVAIASIIVLLTNSFYVYLGLAILSMIFAFSLLNRNYTAAATAITLNVIFVFSLIQPDQWAVIQYRLIDTIIGAVVSIIVAYVVFPNWEYQTIEAALHDVLESNKNYLKQIAAFYHSPSSDDTAYRLSRKEAFLKSSELNASFQRFTHDPKSKQKHFSAYYQLVLMNQSMLSTMATLGSFIQNHHHADLNDEFQIVAKSITDELTEIQQLLKKEQVDDFSDAINSFQQASEDIEQHWSHLETRRNKELEKGKKSIDKSFRLQLQEVRLMKEELHWMQELTQNMKETVLTI